MLSAGTALQKFGVGRTAENGEGEAMKLGEIVQRRRWAQSRRKLRRHSCRFEATGEWLWSVSESFARHASGGLTNAVNMDTGYVNYLSVKTKSWMCCAGRGRRWGGRAVCGGRVYRRAGSEAVSLYRKTKWTRLSRTAEIPICFQTSRLHGKSSAGKKGRFMWLRVRLFARAGV